MKRFLYRRSWFLFTFMETRYAERWANEH